MANLQTTLQTLAATFALDLVTALRGMPLEEILAESKAPIARAKTPPTKRGRPRAAGAAVSVDAIVAVLRKHKGGLRAEHLRKALGAAKSAFNYHAAKALEAKKIRKTGKKRATTYFVVRPGKL